MLVRLAQGVMLALAFQLTLPAQAPCGLALEPGTGNYGMDGFLTASTVFDDGTGPAIYVSVVDTIAGQSIDGLAKYAGGMWSSGGVFSNQVTAFKVFDDGTGPALYASGYFTQVDGVPLRYVAKRVANGWAAVGGPLGHSGALFSGHISHMEVFDDGTGAALYAIGEFSLPGTFANVRCAKWDGTNWSVPGAGITDYPADLVVFDDGTGPALYVVTWNTFNGTSTTLRKWDGTSWTIASSLGAVVGSGSPTCLSVWNSPQGARMVVGGRFFGAGGAWVAEWTGSTWTALGSSFTGTSSTSRVNDMIPWNFQGNEVLVAAGSFRTIGGTPRSGLAAWNGSSWLDVGQALGISILIRGVAKGNWNGSGGSLLVAGAFEGIDSLRATNFASRDATGWTSWYTGQDIDFSLNGLKLVDDGTGASVYAMGPFTYAGDTLARGIARWGTAGWSAVTTAPTLSGSVHDLVGFDDGGGTDLYATGDFSGLSGSSGVGIAKREGQIWTGLGSGLAGGVGRGNKLATFEELGSRKLFVGGYFASVNGIAASSIARWDGTSFTPVGGGLGPSTADVRAFEVFDDGTGPALYAGGTFTTAGSVSASRVARWDGVTWSPLAAGSANIVQTLITFDDGTGPALWAGCLTLTSTPTTPLIMKWTGSAWVDSSQGLAYGSVYDFELFDDGTGIRLYACGRLRIGALEYDMCRWSGTYWEPVLDWTNSLPQYLVAEESQSGPTLWIGGITIPQSPNSPSGLHARYRLTGPGIITTQAAPGQVVSVSNVWLDPSKDVYNIFSLDPCPAGPGLGPYGGLCFTDPGVLIAELLAPPGALPFRPMITGPRAPLGDYLLPPGLVFECVSAEVGPLGIECLSPVRRVSVR